MRPALLVPPLLGTIALFLTVGNWLGFHWAISVFAGWLFSAPSILLYAYVVTKEDRRVSGAKKAKSSQGFGPAD